MKTQAPTNEPINKFPQLKRVVSLPETAKGVYANVAVIKHTEREFIFDFILLIDEEAQLVSRVIMSPPHASAFLEAFRLNVEKHEAVFGQIKKTQKPNVL